MVMSLTIIEPFDVIKNVGSGLFPGEIPLAIDPFTFEQGEEAFHRRVIETIPFRIQRTLDPVLTQQRLKSVAGVLGSAVGVVDQPGRGTAPSSGPLKGLDGQRGGEPLTHRPADNSPGVEIHDGGQVEPAFPRADIGDVRNPALIGGGAFFVEKGDPAAPGYASIGRPDDAPLSGLGRVRSDGS